MNKILLVLSFATILTGCAPKTVQLNSALPQTEINDINSRQGDANIHGSAFLRQNSGGIVTCAGANVALVPDTNHTRERIIAIYGNAVFGFKQAYLMNSINFTPDLSAKILEISKITTCDADGNFKFNNVPDGIYYITVPVIWKVAGTEGGYLMQRVQVMGGIDINEIISM